MATVQRSVIYRSLGIAPVLDFDGTLARLPVAWDALRASLSVDSVDELWDHGIESWAPVRAAEVEAARFAEPVPEVMRALAPARAFAVLTSNDEDAVDVFVERRPELRQRLGVVVGRRALGGRKTDYEVFARGFATCVAATAEHRGAAAPVYLGDQAYELEFARKLGALAMHVRELGLA